MSNISINPTYKPPNAVEKLITSVKNNTSKNLQTYLLFMVPIILLLCYFLYKYNFSNRTNNVIANLDYKNKLNLKPLPKCAELEDKYQYKLCDYYINSSFMTPCVGNQHYDYLSIDMIKEVVFSGARYIQIPICEADVSQRAIPVVATAEYGQRVITSLNTLDIQLVLKTLRNIAFKLNKQEINYPLFIHFVLHTKNTYTLNLLAGYIKDILGDILVDVGKYEDTPIFLEKICNLVNKVVIFATPEYIGTKLEDVIVPTTKLFEIYHYGELGALSIPSDSVYTNDYNKRLSTKEQEQSAQLFRKKYPTLDYVIKNADTIGNEILNDKGLLNNIASFNKVGMTLVKPLNPADVISNNFDPGEAFYLGCQFIAMNFQTKDENMDKYLDIFKESSFRLKPDSMRFSEQEVPAVDIEKLYDTTVKVNNNIINDFYGKYGNQLITLEPYSLLNTYLTQVENNLRFSVGLDQKASKKVPKPILRQAFIPRRSKVSTGNNVSIYLESAAAEGQFLTYNNNSFMLQPLGNNKKELLPQSFYVEKSKVKDDERAGSKGGSDMISLRLIDDSRPLYLAFENKTVKAYADSPQVEAMNNMSFYVGQPKFETIVKIITLYDDGLKTMSGGLIGALEGNVAGATEYIILPPSESTNMQTFNFLTGSQFVLQNKAKKTFITFDNDTGFLYDKSDKILSNSLFNIVREKGNYVIENKNGDMLILYNRNLIRFAKKDEITSNENLFKVDISYNLL